MFSDTEDKILHEIVECAEWSIVEETTPKKPKTGELGKHGSQWVSTLLSPLLWILSYVSWFLWEYVGKYSIPDLIVALRHMGSSCKLNALRPHGLYGQKDIPVVAAVLTEDRLEVRRSNDNFAKPVENFVVTRDPLIQLSIVSISPDGRFVALTGSDGFLTLFDCEKAEQTALPLSKGYMISGRLLRKRIPSDMAWIEPVVDEDTHELVVGDYGGNLRVVAVKQGGLLTLRASFKAHVSLPGLLKSLSSIAYSKKGGFVIMGSTVNKTIDYDVESCWGAGLSLWRTVDQYPFIQLFSDIKSPEAVRSRPLYSKFVRASDGAIKMDVNPSGTTLVTLFASGAIATWAFPSLRLIRLWMVSDLPRDSTIVFKPKATKWSSSLPNGSLAHYPVDVKWWSDSSVVLTQAGGAVYILDVTGRDLQSVTHNSFEQFYPGCAISRNLTCEPLNPESFLVLEENATGKPWHREHTSEDDVTSGMDTSTASEDAERMKTFLQELSVNLGFEEPVPSFPSKSHANVSHRLSLFQKASPEDIFHRKLADREYGEALAIAERFALDTDLVYKTRWRGEPISKITIVDFLCRIKDPSFVLQQCLDKVPSDPDVVKELIDVGLRQTDLAKIIALNPECYLAPDEQNVPASRKAFPSSPEALKTTYVSEKVDISRLSEEQIAMIGHRRQLVRYVDALHIYEEMLGGGEKAVRYFLADEYGNLRTKTLLEVALDCSHHAKLDQLNILRSIKAGDLRIFWLDVLSSLPEITPPDSYQFLIPSLRGGLATDLENEKNRTPDWCEEGSFTAVIDQKSKEITERMDELFDALIYKGPVTPLGLTEWFKYRIVEIEKMTGLIENSRQLVQIGVAKGVEDLDLLKEEFDTLQSLVYHAGHDEMQYDKLIKLSDEAVLQLFDSPDILPFLRKCDRKTRGRHLELLRQLVLKGVSSPDGTLDKCLKAFQQSLPNMPEPVVPNAADSIELALECILACHRTDQIEEIKAILECLPARSDVGGDGDVLNPLFEQISQMHHLLECLEFAAQFGIRLSVRNVKDIQSDKGKVIEFLTALLSRATEKSHTDVEWKNIFDRYRHVGSTVFPLLERQPTIELFVRALLLSGKSKNLELATRFLTLPDQDRQSTALDTWVVNDVLSSRNSIDLILSAAKECLSLAETCDASNQKLHHAERCLKLIATVSPEAVRELELVKGMKNLAIYGVQTEPWNVRTTSDRFRFIQEALDSEKFKLQRSEYRNLLKLGESLGITNRSRIVEAVARKAFIAKDFELCYELCEELIKDRKQNAWSLCLELAESDDFSKEARRRELQEKLVQFAITSCPDEQLQHATAVRNKVELRKLQYSSSGLAPSFTGAHLDPVAKLSVDPCLNILDDKFRTSSYVEMQGCLENLSSDIDILAYHNLTAVGRDKENMPSEKVLLNSARDTFACDASLSMQLLGCLKEKKLATDFFDLVPETPVVFDLVAYYAALELGLQTTKGKAGRLLQQDMESVIKNVLQVSRDAADPALLDLYQTTISRRVSPKAKPPAASMDQISHPSASTTPRPKLKGVDENKFKTDQKYRTSAILRASATQNRDELLAALQAGEEYNIPSWEMAAAFVKFLYTNPSLTVAQIDRSLGENQDVLDHLRNRKQDFVKFSGQSIQPLMADVDISVLESYYEFLEGIKKAK